MSVSLAEMVGGHRERLSSFTTERMQLTGVATLDGAIELMERLHQARMTWRASVDEDELLRADLRLVLANSYRKMAAEDFWLIYSHAAEWLDFHPARVREPSAPVGSALGAESDWLFHCEFEIQGKRLQLLDVLMAGNDGEGVILEVSPGVYVVEARVMTYGIDRRISRVRVHPKRETGTPGGLAGEVGVDLAAVAVCDVDRLAAWAHDHEDEWQRWGHQLWYGRTTPAGLYACEPARTVVPFIDSGLGDGTYPVYYLMNDGRAVGLEAAFLGSPDARKRVVHL